MSNQKSSKSTLHVRSHVPQTRDGQQSSSSSPPTSTVAPGIMTSGSHPVPPSTAAVEPLPSTRSPLRPSSDRPTTAATTQFGSISPVDPLAHPPSTLSISSRTSSSPNILPRYPITSPAPSRSGLPSAPPALPTTITPPMSASAPPAIFSSPSPPSFKPSSPPQKVELSDGDEGYDTDERSAVTKGDSEVGEREDEEPEEDDDEEEEEEDDEALSSTLNEDKDLNIATTTATTTTATSTATTTATTATTTTFSPKSPPVEITSTSLDPQEIRASPQACLFVASLSAAKSEDQLQESVTRHFKRWGHLLNVKVFKDWQQRPYSFVQFSRIDDARRALVEAQGTVVDERHIRIEPARVNRSLIIGRYAMDPTPVTRSSIEDLVGRFGSLESIRPQPNPATGIPEGSVCVKFAYREDAIRAYLHLRGDPEWHVDWANQYGPSSSSSSSPSSASSSASSSINPNLAANLTHDFSRRIDRCSLFVGQLNPQLITQADLTSRFSRYGEMLECTLVNRSQGTSFPRCAFAFVRYLREEAASRAISGEDGTRWLDRNIRVQYREPRDHSSIPPPPLAQAPAPPPPGSHADVAGPPSMVPYMLHPPGVMTPMHPSPSSSSSSPSSSFSSSTTTTSSSSSIPSSSSSSSIPSSSSSLSPPPIPPASIASPIGEAPPDPSTIMPPPLGYYPASTCGYYTFLPGQYPPPTSSQPPPLAMAPGMMGRPPGPTSATLPPSPHASMPPSHFSPSQPSPSSPHPHAGPSVYMEYPTMVAQTAYLHHPSQFYGPLAYGQPLTGHPSLDPSSQVLLPSKALSPRESEQKYKVIMSKSQVIPDSLPEQRATSISKDSSPPSSSPPSSSSSATVTIKSPNNPPSSRSPNHRPVLEGKAKEPPMSTPPTTPKVTKVIAVPRPSTIRASAPPSSPSSSSSSKDSKNQGHGADPQGPSGKVSKSI